MVEFTLNGSIYWITGWIYFKMIILEWLNLPTLNGWIYFKWLNLF